MMQSAFEAWRRLPRERCLLCEHSTDVECEDVACMCEYCAHLYVEQLELLEGPLDQKDDR